MPRTAINPGSAPGATAGRYVDAKRKENYKPAHAPFFPLPDKVEEISPFIFTYGQWTGDIETDVRVPPNGAPESAYYDSDRAQHAVDFIERLVHFQGRYAGNLFRLCHWQERFVRYVFGWQTSDEWGQPVRLIRTVYLEIPRKNGKSTFAAALSLYLAYADNEAAPQVFYAASDKDQAGIAYGMARALIEADEELALSSVIYNSTRKIEIPGTRGELRALSKETSKAYGLNLHGLVFDELMAQPDRILWDALTTSQGARAQPLIIAITTAGWDRQTVAFEQREYARQIASGSLVDPTFLGVCYSCSEDADWTNPETWKSAAPSLGETIPYSYYDAKCKSAMGKPTEQNAFRTLMLCQWVGQSKRIIPMVDWDYCDKQEYLALDKQDCFGGLDLSKTTDMTALLLDFPHSDGTHSWLGRIWVPEDGLREKGLRDRAPYEQWVEQGYLHTSPGPVIDYSETVKPALEEFAQRFRLKDISYDRWSATELANDLENEGFTMVKVGQGFSSMSPPTKELLRLIVSRKLRLNGNPVLRWMSDNAGGETDAAENLKLSKTKSATRIDGLVAGVMALDGAMRRGKKKQSVYEQRGPEDIYAQLDRMTTA